MWPPPVHLGAVLTSFLGTEGSNTRSGCMLGPRAYFDSGANVHLSFDRSRFSTIRKTFPGNTVMFGGGSQPVEGVGEIPMDCIVAGKIVRVVLKNVLYVPTAWCTLLSVKQATKAGCHAVLHDDCARLYMGDKCILEAPADPDGLWRVASVPAGQSPVFTTHALVVAPTPDPELWHRRFGHLGYENLAKLVANEMVTGVKVSAEAFRARSETVCEPCVLGKSARKPFPTSHTRTTERMELIHMDVCGPLPVYSIGGARYFATFIDDFTGLSVVVPIRHKSDVFTAAKTSAAPP